MRNFKTGIAILEHLDKTKHSPEWSNTNDASEYNDKPLQRKTISIGF